MDQGKLFKAFERNKTFRQSKPQPSVDPSENVGVLTQTQTQTEAVKILPDMLPKTALATSGETLGRMRNPNPMAIEEMKKSKLVYSGMKNRAVLNAYRELRIKLMDQSDSSSITVMISSVDSDEMSILTAMNLAISFSLDLGSSALLVDCNPYGTDIQSLVTSSLSSGITDYIQNKEMPLDEIIYPSGVERVSVIPAGNNPSAAVELFSSSSMEDLVYELQNRYNDRCIIINAPPVLASSEARVLTKFCNHTVLTVPYGKTDTSTIEESVAAIGAAHVSGIVYQQ